MGIMLVVIAALFWKPVFHLWRIAVDDVDSYHAERIKEWWAHFKGAFLPEPGMKGPTG